MCGIFGVVGEQSNAAKVVLDGLKRLEYRGYDSWGIAVVDEKSKQIEVKKRVGKIGRAKVDDLPKGTFGLGHTRWATHGGVSEENAHPHLDCSGSLILIHNGIVENYDQLKKDLKKDHKYASETDSEVVVHLIEELVEKYSFEEAVRKAFLKLEGLNAIIVMHPKLYKFVALRNGSPLVVGYGSSKNYLASDAAALLPYTKRVYFLEDMEMAVVDSERVTVKSVEDGKKLKRLPLSLTWKTKEAEKGRFKHFMLKEIYEQPVVLERIISSRDKSIKNLAKKIGGARSRYLLGCGTASYAAIAGEYLFSKVASSQVDSAIGSEFSFQSDFLDEDSVVLALSQSGETMDILESVRAAKKKKAKIIALVNVLGSTLYRIADEKLLLNAGPEKAVASTKAFIAKLGYLILLAYSLGGKEQEGKRVLEKSIVASRKVLTKQAAKKIKRLATKVESVSHMYVVGRGLSYPASLEAALKIKEISYIHAEGFAAGELKHGVIALIEKGTPCLVYVPSDDTFGAALAGAMELKARGAYIIGVAESFHEVFDYHIPIKDAGVATIIPNVIVGQLLGYYLAVAKGLDPDMPRNLAKSVTVK